VTWLGLLLVRYEEWRIRFQFVGRMRRMVAEVVFLQLGTIYIALISRWSCHLALQRDYGVATHGTKVLREKGYGVVPSDLPSLINFFSSWRALGTR
jgi:hypothetical protein